MAQFRNLHKLVEPYRSEQMLVDGMLIPRSAAILLSMLETETDPDSRYGLYRHLLLECGIAGRTQASVQFFHRRFLEFRDVVSLMSYSEALAENGDIDAAVSRAKEALDLAIVDENLVNFAAGNLVRQAIKTGSVDVVNQAMDALADSTAIPRTSDCALEADWADKAEALGADPELIAWVRSIAAARRERS